MELSDDFYIPTNEFQTAITKDFLSTLPEEVAEQLLDFVTNVPYIQNLISPDRRRAKDMPHDEEGKVIVDLANPHILEDMDYFRPAALHFKKHGCYTFLRPNPNPNSEYKKWINEEKRRCREGFVRESDGEWVTGYMYWYINYCPIMLTKIEGSKKKAIRVEDFPEVWEGVYYRYHYMHQAREAGHHGIELARRGCGKSFGLASMMAKNLILGESTEVCKRVTTILTAYQKEYLADKDGTLSKFEPMINFISENTEFPRLRLRNSSQDMFWQMGYLDSYGRKKGSLNSVVGVSSKDDSGKLRGKRGHIYFEEMGSFPNLLEIFDVVRQGMEEGDYTYGFSYLVGTASEKESNFESAKTLLYNPEGYNIYAIKNVYDKPKQGKSTFGYFFPAYVNRKGCYNKDGVSDVVKALVQILQARYKAKYGSDPNSVLRVIAEMPITPAEAIIKVKNAFFPVTALTERLQQIDLDSKAYDDVKVGNLVLEGTEVKFRPSDDKPIRKYGVDNSTQGAIEIYEVPQRNSSNKVYDNRYIIGHDPVDNDQAESHSLSSTFVLDLYTDRIVAEYTGRQPFADDNFEIVRLLCLFYNAKCLYEAHPYSQLVHTPNGDKLWKDIQVGDYLFSPTKGIVKVTDIPVDEYMDIYKIKLSDGRVIEASDNHIWLVYKGTSKTPIEVTTKQMLEEGLINKYGQHRYFIPEHRGVDYSRKELPIDPYTMGLLLSEGSLRGSHCTKNYVQISSSFEDMKFYECNIPYSIKHIGNKGFSWHIRIPNCKEILSNYGLYGTDSHTKFIPKDYLLSHRVQRMELLKGIMDGDGCARTKGASILITCSEKLAKDILTLVRSLGIKGWLQTSREGVYRVAIASEFKVFKLPRKVVNQYVYKPYTKGSKASAILNKTAIDSIELSHKEMGKCVTVDSDDGLYLIGDYVVTHNCNKKGIFAYFQKLQCTHLLADTPEYLRDKQMVKYSSFGSNAHPYTEKVYTPDGLKLWEEVQIGDLLFAPDGTTTKVIDIPIDKELDIYELTLKDGRKVRASGGHLWYVYKGAKVNKNPILKTTLQLKEDLLYYREGRNAESKYYIHKNCGVEYNKQFIPMNPYLLGLMLGDGCMSSKFTTVGKYLEFASSIEDMNEYMEYLKLPYRTLDNRHHKIELEGWSDIVHYLKLANTTSHTKFIPDCYKYNSREIRLEVLKGLFDTDGTIAREGGTPYYTTTSKQLALDVLEVARSLGMNGNMTETSNSYGSIYNVRLYTTTIVFRLKRKANRQKQVRCRDIFTGIIDIKYVGKEKAKCVTVDREDGLYLIGDYITTHNCKGVNASAAINNYANGLIRDWLLKPIPTIIVEDGVEKQVQISNLYFIRGRALLEELIAFDPVRNFDRIRALGMLMLYREEKIILYGSNLNAESAEKADKSYLGNDDFFKRNYDNVGVPFPQ